MTTTPLPPLSKSSPEQDALFDHIYEYGADAEGVHQRLEKVCQAYATKARADLEAEIVELQNGLAMALHDAVLIRMGEDDAATRQATTRIDKIVAKYDELKDTK